ncbi:MAG: YifB family Mg chelatase-like AAA ATPase [Solirubrobacterales bacterium]
MLAVARTFAVLGVEAREVRVEADVQTGLPTFVLSGLPDAAVRESRERVRAAIVNSGFDFPLKRITANLAPAHLRKAGPGFDLAIAAAVLAASGQLDSTALADISFTGELALDGSLRPVPGTLAMAEAVHRTSARAIVVPPGCGPEAALAEDTTVLPIERLEQLKLLGTDQEPTPSEPLLLGGNGTATDLPDLADLRGQPYLRRAVEFAAAGGHSLLITGPPGAGKSMAARRLPPLLPALARQEMIEALRVASACGKPLDIPAQGRRPFRAPHHTISTAGLVGGGAPPRAGEITLAHRGVLLLDELPEFRRDALEALRQPLEDGRVLIARAASVVELPCRFQLVATANPCPCGRGAASERCECPSLAIRSHRARISGALADRIDIAVAVEQPSAEALAGPPGETSRQVRERVLAARERQEARLLPGRCNAEMTPAETRRNSRLDGPAGRLLADSERRLALSGRAHERVLRVARTVADLRGRDRVAAEDVAEALMVRRRGTW